MAAQAVLAEWLRTPHKQLIWNLAGIKIGGNIIDEEDKLHSLLSAHSPPRGVMG